MSTITQFFNPSRDAQPLVRSRLSLLASRLKSVDTETLTHDAARSFAQLWLVALEDASSVRQLTPAWTKTLIELHQNGQANELINGSLIADLLHHYEPQLPDADYATVWQHLERSRRLLCHRTKLSAIAEQNTEIAGRIVGQVEAVYGKGDRLEADLDFSSLRKALAAFFKEWSAAALANPTTAQISALDSFFRLIIGRHLASTEAWQLMLQALNSAAELNDLGLDDVVHVLVEALPRFSTLHLLMAKAHQGEKPLQPELLSLIGLHILLTSAPLSSLASHTTSLLQFEAIVTAVKANTPALDGTVKGLREALRLKLEQYQIDWWDDALSWLRKIEKTAATLQELGPVLETEINQALANATDARRLAGLALALIRQSTLLGNGTLDAGITTAVVRNILVLDYGCDPTAAPWSQAETLAEAIMQALSKVGSNTALLPARTQLRKLAETVTEVGQYSLKSSRATAAVWKPTRALASDENSRARCQRDMGFLLQRIALEHRAARPQQAVTNVLYWFTQEVATHLQQLPGDRFVLSWQDLIESSAPKLGSALTEAAQRIAEALPRMTAALKLIRHHERIGMHTAKHVMARLPEYQKTVGERGTNLCARDNSLTLLQTGRILLSGVDDPTEKLASWWNSVVAAYIVNRPKQLFESNLQALHAALQSALTTDELDRVFPILHEVYKESLGITDLPIVFFRESREVDVHPNHNRATQAAAAFPTTMERPRWVKLINQLTNPGAKSFSESLETFLTQSPVALNQLGNHGAAWTQMRDFLRDWNQIAGPEVLIRTLGCISSEATRRKDTAGEDLSAFALGGITLIVQETLATQLESSWASAAGPRLAAAAPSGAGDDVAQGKCARDLQLFNDFLIRQLRTQSMSVAALNSCRFLIECVVPYVDYPAETWREVFADWQRSHVGQTNTITRPLLDGLAQLFIESAGQFPELRGICQSSFSPNSTLFSNQLSTEKITRGVISTLLASGAAPATGVFSGDSLRCAGFRHTAIEKVGDAEVFDSVLHHVDTLFDSLDGVIFYELQELVPAMKTAYTEQLPRPTFANVGSDLQQELAESKASLNVFKKLSRTVTGPGAEELATALWRATLAAGLAAHTGRLSDIETQLLRAWLHQSMPDATETTVAQLSAELTAKIPAAQMPSAVAAGLKSFAA